VQSQQLPTESQVLEDEVLPGTENADQPTEEMSERHDHGKNCSGKIRIQLFAKSFILQVYDVLARHRSDDGQTGRNRITSCLPTTSVGLVLTNGQSFCNPVREGLPTTRWETSLKGPVFRFSR
jgi:hypothetical protein